MTDFKAEMPKSISAGAPPQTPLGSLQRTPDPLTGFGGRFAAVEGLGWGTGRKGEGGEVEGGKGRVTVEPGPLRALLCHCGARE